MIFSRFLFCTWLHISVLMANFTPPDSIGFVPNPNLVLPPYIAFEVVVIYDIHGVPWHLRRPRPLSLLAGAQVVLQSDRELLAR
jgi:hypothetical protein